MKLEINNLSYGYSNKPIGNNVSFSIDDGQSLCLLGPNGIGKTTLLKTLLQILKPLSGEILIDGENIGKWTNKKLGKFIAYVPQQHTPPFPFSVMDMVIMGRAVHLGSFKNPGNKDIEIAFQIMVKLGIDHLMNKPYTEISGGERQLVMIARALSQEPKILILDEPTSNLDFGNQVKVLTHIKNLSNQGLAVIMSSHIPDHAFLYSSKVALIKNGSMFKIGAPQEVMTEENLKELYGINIKVIETNISKTEKTRVCVPILTQSLSI